MEKYINGKWYFKTTPNGDWKLFQSEAHKWWNDMNDKMKSEFVIPKCAEDIEKYFNNPAEYLKLEYGML